MGKTAFRTLIFRGYSIENNNNIHDLTKDKRPRNRGRLQMKTKVYFNLDYFSINKRSISNAVPELKRTM
jgi:hypothetical protein